MTCPGGGEVQVGIAEHAAYFSERLGRRRLVESPDEWGTYMMHIPIEAATLPAALELARRLSAPLADVDAARVAEAAVSHRGNQFYRWSLFCNRPSQYGRCVLASGHPAGCEGEPWRST